MRFGGTRQSGIFIASALKEAILYGLCGLGYEHSEPPGGALAEMIKFFPCGLLSSAF
jgi:hypothetical protein